MRSRNYRKREEFVIVKKGCMDEGKSRRKT
jgi:hypothetical protein